MRVTTTEDRPVLLAYLHLRPGTPAATRGLLRDYIEGFADREGYELGEVVVGVESQGEALTVRNLIGHIRSSGAETVVVTGPSRAALSALRQMAGVRVLTLADVSPIRHAHA